MLIQAVFLLALAAPSLQQEVLGSPCPEILRYEPLAPHDDFVNRWNATITLPPGAKWMYVSVLLDKKAHILGNSVGDVYTKDNMEYRIENPLAISTYSQASKPRPPISIFVKYGNEDPPKVQTIRLDGREICFDNGVKQNIVELPSPPATPIRNPAPLIITEKASTYTSNTPSYGFKVTIPEQEAQCGIVKMNNPVALVVDGTPTQEGQWPWQVALFRLESVNPKYACGGTLVSKRHVITAAHCTTVKDERPPQKIPANTLMVYLGKHDLIYSVEGVQIKLVSKVTIHPDYDTVQKFTRDLSILELHRPVLYTNWVQPACLWPDHLADLTHIIGQKGKVVGWGNDGSGKLLLAEMPVVSQETCLRAKADFYISLTSDYTYCAGTRTGQSACNGDSGGGMVFQIKGAWYLRGVVSFSPTKPNENVCDPSYYVVFTDLAKFLPWIRENIEPY